GENTGDYGASDYRGNWGAYPYLPSGIIIAQDMQNGVFILDAAQAFAVTDVGVEEIAIDNLQFTIYPNPTNEILNVDISTSLNVTGIKNGKTDIEIIDVLGNIVIQHLSFNIYNSI